MRKLEKGIWEEFTIRKEEKDTFRYLGLKVKGRQPSQNIIKPFLTATSHRLGRFSKLKISLSLSLPL